MNNFNPGSEHPSQDVWLRAATAEPSDASSEPTAEPAIPVPEKAAVTAPISRDVPAEQQLPTQAGAAAAELVHVYKRALQIDGK